MSATLDGSDTDRDPADATAPPAIVEGTVPAVVSAAWELELLIAGAVTFALFQLPGSLDAFREWGAANLPGTGGLVAVTMGYVYAKAVLYVLIVAFTTNLAARAYWVGLVGLHSVYPRGVRWDQVRMGPIAQREYRRRIPSLPSIIARVDNFASVIFSFAFLIVITFAFSVAVFAVFALIAWAISARLFAGRHTLVLVYAMAGIALLPGLVAVAVDRWIGARLAPDSRAARRIANAMRVLLTVNGSALFGPILLTLTSNGGRRRMTALFYLVVFGSMGVTMAEFFYRSDIVRAGSPAYAPDDIEVRGIDPAHYESLRAPRPGDFAATIQSDVVDGAYVRLFIPYRDERHDYAIRTRCPGVVPLRAAGPHFVDTHTPVAATDSGAARVLACLVRISGVTIDGVAPPDLTFRFYRHPASGMLGMVAYLPTAAMPPGMHTISLAPLPRLPGSESRRPLLPTTIPFWR